MRWTVDQESRAMQALPVGVLHHIEWVELISPSSGASWERLPGYKSNRLTTFCHSAVTQNAASRNLRHTPQLSCVQSDYGNGGGGSQLLPHCLALLQDCHPPPPACHSSSAILFFSYSVPGGLSLNQTWFCKTHSFQRGEGQWRHYVGSFFFNTHCSAEPEQSCNFSWAHQPSRFLPLKYFHISDSFNLKEIVRLLFILCTSQLRLKLYPW